jgi:hypothetical protein
MNRAAAFAGLTIVVVLVAGIFAYSYFNKPANISDLNPIDDVQTPIWKGTDLELYKVENKYTPNTVYVYDITDNDKPQFYNGPMPLKYRVGYPANGLPGSSYSNEKPLFYNYSDSVTYFVYNGAIVIGAQTQDKNGHVLAEVGNIIFSAENNQQVMEIEEHHYNPDGQTVFKCTSRIDPYTGQKLSESGKIGTKLNDYYFLWPKLY